MSIVVIHGPEGSGKTRLARSLMLHYGCKRIVDGWDGRSPLIDGDLALTNMPPPFAIENTQVVAIEKAKKECAS